MKRFILFLLVSVNVGAYAQLSTTDIANGLKEALTKGVTKGADSLSKLEGYFKNPKIKIPFVKKVNPDLVAYTTDLAIQGLFIKIAEEEKNIRANPVARTTDLLKKVFGGK